MITLSPAHIAAVLAAVRLPAITARHELLEAGGGSITITCYPDPRAEDGAAPAGDPLAVIYYGETSTLDAENLRIELEPGAEGTIIAAGSGAWARIQNRAGAWWGDVSISDADGDGEIKLSATDFAPGRVVRMLSGVIQG